MRYTCNVREYSTSKDIKLTIYKEYKHKGEKIKEMSKTSQESNPINNQQSTYTCNKCEYVTDIQSMLNKHEQTKHMKSDDKDNLINNQQSTYNCYTCTYKTDTQSMLNIHERWARHMKSVEKRN